jgi:hypothetical protein
MLLLPSRKLFVFLRRHCLSLIREPNRNRSHGLTLDRANRWLDAVTVIEIRPHRWGWKAFESPGVEPVFPEKDQAIEYAQNRVCFRSGEIRVLDSTGKLQRTIPFSEADRKL